jgi:hypothetical protein
MGGSEFDSDAIAEVLTRQNARSDTMQSVFQDKRVPITSVIRTDLQTYPQLDYFPTDASAENNVKWEGKLFAVSDHKEKERRKLTENYLYENSTANHGFKTAYETGGIPIMTDDYDEPQDMDIDKTVYFEQRSTARYGFHDVDREVLERSSKERGNIGAARAIRNRGIEQSENTAILPQNAFGFKDPQTAVPRSTELRINDTRVQPANVFSW